MTRPARRTLAVLVALAVALPGVGVAKEDCDLVKEPAIGDVVPVRLTCLTDLDPDLLFDILRDPLQQVAAFSSLGEKTRVLEGGAGPLRVQQFHLNRMISDREVIVTWSVSGDPERRVVAWQKDADQSGTTGQHVVPDVHEGRWEISPEGSGAKVVYYVQYLPGGHVPDKVVKAFVGKGVRNVMKELFSYVRGLGLAPGPARGTTSPAGASR